MNVDRRSILPTLVARQAAATPAAIAVLDGSRETSYSTLNGRANRLAHYLRGRGVGPETLVGVCLPRGVDLVVALLAVWKAGAAYVPLGTEDPAGRLAWILADTGARTVLTTSALAGMVSAAQGAPVCLDEIGPTLAGQPDTEPDSGAVAANVAYVIYTSGSTGKPKGVVISFAAIGNRMAWAVDRHGMSATDRVLQKTALTFDAAGWEIFAPLISGGTVVLAPVGTEHDPTALVHAVIANAVTILQGVPSVLRLVADEPGWPGCTSLRLVFSAGEPLHAELGRRLAGPLDIELWNTYGPTECAIDLTAHRADPAQVAGPVSIGQPLDNVRVLVLDPYGEPVPVGVPGELYAGGISLGRGYLGRADLTAERFVPDPYGVPGSRVYRTGDMVRWHGDGTLEYLSRLDQQLKINGVRIEPGEVEAALVAHPDVTGAVVTATTDGQGFKRLIGYVCAGRTLDSGELREFLRGSLPDVLVPAVFSQLASLPLTASGKIDYAALPVPEPATGIGRPPYLAPRNQAEQIVAGVWAELLDVDRVGVHDDFFQLGGSSLVLTRLANRLRAASGRKITLRGLFGAPTVEHQARLIMTDGDDGPPLEVVPRDGRLALSFGQHRMWFLDRMRPASPEWVAPLFVRLPATIDADTVQRALDTLAARHEVLRTRYPTDGGVPYQVIDAPGPVELRVVDADPAAFAILASAEVKRGFDLTDGPVWRALLARTSPTGWTLLLTLHHIAGDGWSSVVLERELRALCTPGSAALPEVPFQYADFAAWQRRWLTDDILTRELRYWRGALAGLVPLDLPADRPRADTRDPSGGLVPFDLPPDLAEAVTALGRRHGATPFMTLLTAFGVLLARYTGQWDVVVGTPVAGRTRPEIQGTVGFFLNTLVLRCDLAADISFAEALVRVRDMCRSAFAHQALPFERLVDDLQPDRDLSRTPLYNVAFDLHDEGITGGAMQDEDVDAFVDSWHVAKTDLTLFIRRAADGSLRGAFEYAAGLFDRDRIERMSGHFVRLLAEAVTPGDPGLSRLRFMPAAELALVTDPPLVGGPVAPVVHSPHQFFEHRAAATPDAVAVVYEDTRLTYAELNARANRLAHHLRALGVRTGSLVGVCLDRGVDLVPTLLGVLKSGAAYLPLDPAVPDERLSFIAADAGVSVVVTGSSSVNRLSAISDGVLLVVLDRDAALIARCPATDPPMWTVPDDLMYVIYTSGSTGRPKGVCVSHANVTRLLTTCDELYTFAAHDVWTLFHSYAFDFSVWELWGALMFGARLVVLPQHVTRSPGDLLDVLVREGVTVLSQTPTAFRGLVGLARDGDDRLDDLALRVVVFGGERLDVADLAPWVARFGLAAPTLVNMYGITETTVHTTYHLLEVDDLGAASSPVGHALKDLRVYLLDAAGELVPVGVPGEIHVGGPGVTRGYLRRPALTAARFVPDPFGPAGARLYRSGDLARRRLDGSLEFLGRNDDQVKIRGYRIELGEIQAVLAEHPDVRDAVVLAHQGRLVAYYVPVAGAPPSVDALAGHCATRLPEYMVPVAYVALDRIPLTTNGKLDVPALPGPARDALRTDGGYVAPRTAAEERIADIWTELLDVKAGVHDNFFAVGGQSLLAVRLTSLLQEEFDIALTLRVIFEGPTIAQLARTVEAAVRAQIDQLTGAELALLSHTTLSEGPDA